MGRWVVGILAVTLIVIGTGGIEGMVVVGSAVVILVGGTRLADRVQRGDGASRPVLADVLGWGAIALGLLVLLWGVWNVWLPSMTGG